MSECWCSCFKTDIKIFPFVKSHREGQGTPTYHLVLAGFQVLLCQAAQCNRHLNYKWLLHRYMLARKKLGFPLSYAEQSNSETKHTAQNFLYTRALLVNIAVIHTVSGVSQHIGTKKPWILYQVSYYKVRISQTFPLLRSHPSSWRASGR